MNFIFMSLPRRYSLRESWWCVVGRWYNPRLILSNRTIFSIIIVWRSSTRLHHQHSLFTISGEFLSLDAPMDKVSELVSHPHIIRPKARCKSILLPSPSHEKPGVLQSYTKVDQFPNIDCVSCYLDIPFQILNSIGHAQVQTCLPRISFSCADGSRPGDQFNIDRNQSGPLRDIAYGFANLLPIWSHSDTKWYR